MSTFVKATQVYQQGQRTLPGRYYTSAEIYAEEQERIFTARWICAGRAAEIPEAGDYVLSTLDTELAADTFSTDYMLYRGGPVQLSLIVTDSM